MDYNLTFVTWFWLLVPMPLCVALCVVSYIRNRR